jgi:hypothetical protein
MQKCVKKLETNKKLKIWLNQRLFLTFYLFQFFSHILHELNYYFNELIFTYSLNRNYFNYFYRINFLEQNKYSKNISDAILRVFSI